MKRYEKSNIPRYKSLQEAFKAGSNPKVMKLLKSLLKKKAGIRLDTDIPFGYKNGDGKFRSYEGDFAGGEIRINFRLADSDYVHSVDLFDKKGKPTKSVKFEPQESIVGVINSIVDLTKGQFQEEKLDSKEYIQFQEKRRKSGKGNLVTEWITDPEFKKEREEMIQKTMFSKMYPVFIRDLSPDLPAPSGGTFNKFVKQYLQDNGMVNPHIRAGGKKIKIQTAIEVPITVPEEASEVKDFKQATDIMYTWREQFEDMEDDFKLMMEDKSLEPFGMLVYGNGGTGKSYFFLQQKKQYNLAYYKGAPTSAKLTRILYDYRDKDAIIFDDADSVVTVDNSSVILKMATDDTYDRVIMLPKGTGKDILGGEKIGQTGERTEAIITDAYDDKGEPVNGFKFNAKVVVITNLKSIKDKALRTRMNPIEIAMDKEDIIEKIEEYSDPVSMGATVEMGKEVGEYLTYLVLSGNWDIKNEDLSFRFFKVALRYIKGFPNQWKGKTMRKLGIGVKHVQDLKDAFESDKKK